MIVDFCAHAAGVSPSEQQALVDDARAAGITHTVIAWPETVRCLHPTSLTVLRHARPGSPVPEDAPGARFCTATDAWEPAAASLEHAFTHAIERGVLVHLCLRLRDPRVLPQATPTGAALSALSAALGRASQAGAARIVISGATLAEVCATPGVFTHPSVSVEIAHLQHPMNALRRLVDHAGADRVVFGTNAPVFPRAAGVWRLAMDDLPESARRRVACGNAMRLLNPSGPAAAGHREDPG